MYKLELWKKQTWAFTVCFENDCTTALCLEGGQLWCLFDHPFAISDLNFFPKMAKKLYGKLEFASYLRLLPSSHTAARTI